MGGAYAVTKESEDTRNAFAADAFTREKVFAFLVASCGDEGRCTSDLFVRFASSAIEYRSRPVAPLPD